MSIDIKLISEVRDLTGAGIVDVKNALAEANGDKEKSIEILRKKGIAKAAKRAGKVAAEGLTAVKVAGSKAVIVELNSETDFAAKSDKFKALLAEVVEKVLAGQTVTEETLGEATASIGEKMVLRRATVVEKSGSEVFGAYIHMGGKISALVVLAGPADEEMAKDVAMHVAAMNPRYISRADVPAEVLEKEKAIYTEQLKTQGKSPQMLDKPENMIQNILKGKLDKFYSEVCLLEQSFIKNEDVSVGKYLESKGNGLGVKSILRYEVGEGIEKASCDFAAEVAEQMK